MPRSALGGHLLAGLSTGAVIAFADLLLGVGGVTRRAGPLPGHIVAFGAIATIFWFTWCTVLVGVLTLKVQRARVAQAIGAAFVFPLLTFHMLSTTVRAQTGVFLTLTPLQLFSASPKVFLRRAIAPDQIGSVLILFAVVALALSVSFFWVLPRATKYAENAVRPRIVVLSWLALSMMLGSAALMPWDAVEVWALRDSNPELSLVTSIRSPAMLGIPLVPVEEGPPIASNDAWKKTAATSTGPRPNVALIVLESLRADHVGYMGYARDTTPNIDRLAKNALRMKRAYSSAPMTSTAVSAMLSSQWGRKRKNLDLFTQLDYPHLLPHDLLSELGYGSAYISSQTEAWFGIRRFILTGTSPTYFFDADDWKGSFIGLNSDRCIPDHETVDLAVDWVKKQDAAKPWFLYLSLQRTHHPYFLPVGTPEPFQPANPYPFDYLVYPLSQAQKGINRYDNALLHVDQQVGRFAKFLEDSGQLNHTILIVVGDHGEAFGEHGQVTHGKDIDLAETAIPLMLHWPEGLPPRESSVPVTQLDLMPTIADLLKLPPHPSFQGRSFLDDAAYRDADIGLYISLQGMDLLDSLICYPWKFDIRRQDHTFSLYDLSKDPGEANNLVKTETGIAAAMRTALESQVAAQLGYYNDPSGHRESRNPPRMLRCPALLRSPK